MNAAFAPVTWPAPVPALRAAGLRLGQWAPQVDGQPAAYVWDLRRNCSITPRQLGLAYGVLCALALTVALGFVLGGVVMVFGFTFIELVAVGVALLIWSRHVLDHERIVLNQGELQVTRQAAGRQTRRVFRAAWVRVEPRHSQGSLVELSGQGGVAHVGRYLPAHLRDMLAAEIRLALRQQVQDRITPLNLEPRRT